MPEHLKLQAAQRVVYERAKNIFGLQVLLTVVFAVLLNFIRLFPKDLIIDVLPFIIFLSVIVSLLDLLVFIKYISKMRTNGAKIQEEFDCAVYQMTWNKYNSGSKANKNLVHESFRAYVPDPERPIENWYDIDLDGLSQQEAILACQETNLWYDSNLREKFKNTVVYGMLAIAAISFLVSLVMKQEVGMMVIQIVAPLMPAILLTIKIYQENGKSVTAANELRSMISSLKQSSETLSMEDLRKIQDKIFCSRKDSPLIPEWFYRKKRPQLEEGMKVNAS